MTISYIPSRDPVADDWQVGDMALCVNASPCVHTGLAALRRGAIYTVEGVRICETRGTWPTPLALDMHGITRTRNGWSAARFRKIRPHQEDEDDREVVALLTYAERVTL